MFGRVHRGRECSPSRAIPSRRPGWIAPVFAALMAVVLIAGCGGSYTKSDFVARADAICASALRQTRSIDPTNALGQYVAAVLPIVQSEATQLRALKRPAQDARDKAALSRYLGALAQEVQNYRKLAVAAKRGDGQGVTDAEAALRASPAASLASGYGLRACGTPGATTA
jgi:hypothetical protein